MNYIVTGAAGFIGYHTAKKILEDGNNVLAIDNINDFYDIKLKNERVKILNTYNNFELVNIDLKNKDAVQINLSN